MSDDSLRELYQQTLLAHHKSPKNFRKIEEATHSAEGYNPLCGDQLRVYIHLSGDIIKDISFEGDGCAISRAAASMMTASLKGKNVNEAAVLFDEFHKLIVGRLKPDTDENHLGKLTIFSGIWQYPARVKCASLSWHTMQAALKKEKTITTE